VSRHLGGALTAFVDGELDHASREHVLIHLSHCASCRTEVDLLRGLKDALRTEPSSAPDDLAARLLAVTAATAQPAMVPRAAAWRAGTLTSHARARRAAFGLGALALGVGSALALAGPPPSAPVAPVDPTSSGLVFEHASTANEVPFTELDAVTVSATTGR
jgi:anti-sigma factor RsiW